MIIPLLITLLLALGSLSPAAQQPPPRDPNTPVSFYQDVSWSPDGKRLSFTHMTGTMQTMKAGVFVMRADGTEVARVSDENVKAFYSGWSPDGKRLVYGANTAEKKSDIFTADADGTHAVRLTEGAGSNATPAWSPDGKRIAFVSTRDNGFHQIYVMNADGTAQTRLTKDDARDFNPMWSPDSRRIVYYAERGDQKDQVWTMNADGSDAKLLTGGTGHNIFPAWSSDGAHILFTSRRDDAKVFYVFTMKADGTDLRRVADAEALFARPSPDGKRIAFSGGHFPDGALFVMNLDGTNLTRLTK
jgi:TolB protein